MLIIIYYSSFLYLLYLICFLGVIHHYWLFFFNFDFNSLFSILLMVMVIINFIISKVLVLSKNDRNEFPLIAWIPSPFIEIRSVGCSLMFFVPFLWYVLWLLSWFWQYVWSRNTTVKFSKSRCRVFFLTVLRHQRAFWHKFYMVWCKNILIFSLSVLYF